MQRTYTLLALALSGAFFVGCNKGQEKTSQAAPANSTPAPAAIAPAVAPPTATVPQTPDPAIRAAAATEGTGVVHPTTLPSLPSDTTPLTTTTPSSGSESADPARLLTEIAVDTADKKWDAAEADFKKLDAMQLSPEIKDKVAKAHEQFVTARAASQNAPSGATTTEETNK